MDRFNLHDWGSIPIVYNNNFYIHIEIAGRKNLEITTQCLINGGFTYHGKDDRIVREINKIFQKVSISKIRENKYIYDNSVDTSRANMILTSNGTNLYPINEIDRYLKKYINTALEATHDDEKNQIEKIYLNSINNKNPISDEYNLCQKEILKRFDYKKW
jgi:hypothetical protein